MEFGRSYQNIILGVHLNVIYHLLDCVKKYLYLWHLFIDCAHIHVHVYLFVKA